MQTSNKPLSTAVAERILDQFYCLLADLHQPQEVQSVLVGLMTPSERLAFAKRLQIAWLLHQGLSYEAIAKELNVSSATISAVAETKDLSGMNLAYKYLKLDDKAEKAVSKLWFWQKKHHDK